jgi:hypothetical protein
MTPRSFWTIVVKILGLCIGYSFFTTLWRAITISISYASIATMAESYKDAKLANYINDADIAEWSSLVLIILYILVFYLFLFKTQWVIDKLRLDREHTEQSFELNIPHTIILKIAVIAIGGSLILIIFPDLINEIFSYFRESTTTRKFIHNRNITYIVTDTLKIIIGVVMIIGADSIAKFIDRKNKNTIEPLSS